VLLHWPTRAVPLAETLAAFRDMIGGGMTRYVGVSNFSGPWLDLLDRSATAEDRIAFHEVPYSVADRRAERGVLPYAAAHGQLVLAYSPLGHGRSHRWSGLGVLAEIGRARGLTPQQVALAWTVRRPGVVAIPKAVDPAHVRANAAAGDVVLTAAELDRIEAAFPPAARDLRPALPPIGALHRLAMSWSRRAFRQDATS
jgi:diketogulonate reductase-like aldo/keto reductase